MNDLKAFICKCLMIEKDKISQDTSVNQDLGLYGEEAFEFILDFSKSFNVDISHFEFHKYFKPEMDAITGFIGWKAGLEKKRLPLFVSDLEEAIKKGVLN
ncbi:DUF1493 family protein [Elizabethkingia argentiflava]|uniref:DUF1493 family protein n=1 Tax=Elizabethkingia argenteiflava TaxID=2681556 RepID=A0A845PUR3_9FLAO|nr:DUF1493 family protein [Elizabethkingia argenteiflava]NAW50018.1 DUF1493 family protein [Elizabethkingia argenteiflava]